MHYLKFILTEEQYQKCQVLLEPNVEPGLTNVVGEVNLRSYMLPFMNFCILLSFLNSFGSWDSKRFTHDLMKTLHKHREKLYFEILIDENIDELKLVRVMYDEKEARMGLLIKKGIINSFTNHGLNVIFNKDISKTTKKSFFTFV